MNIERAGRLITIHGPVGFVASRALARSGLRLDADDVIVIVEHDDAAGEWVEQGEDVDPTSAVPHDHRPRATA